MKTKFSKPCMNKSYYKVMDVIDSCVRPIQLVSANNMIKLFGKMYSSYSIEYAMLLDRLNIRYKILKVTRNG